MTESALVNYYRCPESLVNFEVAGELSPDSGYFLFGPDTVCFGRTCGILRAERPSENLHDALNSAVTQDALLKLPFDVSQVVQNLRFERYVQNRVKSRGVLNKAIRATYYFFRPLMPVAFRRHFQKFHLRDWVKLPFPHWPVDRTVEKIMEHLLVLILKANSLERLPFIWFWPEGLPACAIATHDVETRVGRDFCGQLMDLDDRYGFKSSFQVVPEQRYAVSSEYIASIKNRGFEVNVHDWNHDGRLFSSHEEFLRRLEQVNRYATEFGATGFRSGALYRNQEWFGGLQFSYDMSVPNVAHLDPQRGGCCTVMPYFVNHILELPVTMMQDYSLFHIVGEYSIDIWKHQIALIAEKHGLISFIVHPDYVTGQRERSVYEKLLVYLAELRDTGQVWAALPAQMNTWWRNRSQMKLVQENGDWRIEGPGNDRARLAHASLEGGRLVYTVGRRRFEHQVSVPT